MIIESADGEPSPQLHSLTMVTPLRQSTPHQTTDVDVGARSEYQPGSPVYVEPNGIPVVVVVRDDDTVDAVHGVCSHLSQLMQGVQMAGETAIRCPHHGICYDLHDGRVVRDQGFYGLESLSCVAAWIADGRVIVRLPVLSEGDAS